MYKKGECTINILNKKFNKLTVLSFAHYDKYKQACWVCKCECGNIKIIIGKQLRTGRTKSCGCLRREKFIAMVKTHGMSKHPLYQVWNNMMGRCYRKKHPLFKYYGGRGIIVCDRWLNFLNFLNDLKESYINGLEIDRINNNGNYCLENIRFTDECTQANNRRNNVYIEYNGYKLTLKQWAIKLNIPYDSLRYRIQRSKKWSIEQALTIPHGTK